jgi:hypothetical protein
MTLEEIMDDVWRAAGEPTDLDPDSDTRYSGGPLLTWVVNQAQNAVATWKEAGTGGTPKIFELVGEAFFKSVVVEGTVASASSGSSIVIESTSDTLGTTDDQYNGWVYDDGTELKLVVDYTGSSYTVTLSDALDTTPSAGDTFSLYKRHFLLLPSSDAWVDEHIARPGTGTRFHSDGQFIAPIRIEDIEDQRVLERVPYQAGYISQLTSVGTPTTWSMFGNRIVFNYLLDEERWFRMMYKRLPTPMTTSDDVPELPEVFHYGLVLWALEWVHRHYGETTDKYSTKLDFRDFMRMTMSAVELADDGSDSDYVYVRRR